MCKRVFLFLLFQHSIKPNSNEEKKNTSNKLHQLVDLHLKLCFKKTNVNNQWYCVWVIANKQTSYIENWFLQNLMSSEAISNTE